MCLFLNCLNVMLFSVCFFFLPCLCGRTKGRARPKQTKKNILEKEMFTAILADFSGCEHA